MRDAETFAALDIGTSKVVALVVASDPAGGLRPLGLGTAPSAGVRKGVVVGVEEVVHAVGVALRRAERAARCQVGGAIVNVGGAHLASLNNRGVAPLSETGAAVEPHDVTRALQSARAVLLPPNREVLHVLPRDFAVDGQSGIQNPVGMVGRRLDVEVHVVTAEATALRNLEQCLRRAGVEPLGFVAPGLATAEAILSAEERELGVAVVDYGAGTTDLVVFHDGAPWHTAALPVGGNNVTRDIAIGLRVPLDVADELKLSYACAEAPETGPDEMLAARAFGGAALDVSRRQLCEIVAARVDETLRLVRAELARAGEVRALPAGFVFAGGAAELDGLLDRAAEVLEAPVRLGRPRLPAGVSGGLDVPAYATVTGLVTWARRSVHRRADLPVGQRVAVAAGRTAVATLTPAAQRFADWLRAFLP